MVDDPNRKTPRQFQCRDYLWDSFEQLSSELECSIDYLINEAMRHYLRAQGRAGAKSTASNPGIEPRPSMTNLQGGGVPPMGARPVTTPSGAARQPALPPMPGARPPASAAQPGSMGMPPLGATNAPGIPPLMGNRAPGAMPSMPNLPPRNAPSIPAGAMGGMPPPIAPPPMMQQHSQPMMQQQQQPMQQHSQPMMQQQPMQQPPMQQPPQPMMQQPVQRAAPVMSQPRMAPQAAAPAQRMLYATYADQDVPVTKEEFFIGRGQKMCDLVIRDTNISRQHARVVLHNGQYWMIDNQSTNGVEFRGAKIQQKRIDEGDVFTICGHDVHFSYR